MSKIVTGDVGKFSQHYPKTPIIVTASSQGRDNAMTAAWHSPISRFPPLYGISISPERFTYQLITESKEFGINFMPWEQASLVARVGGTSGQKLNKFEAFNIEKEEPLKIAAPILKHAYAAYECKLVDSKPYGDHIWVVGEIVTVHLLEAAFTSEQTINMDKIKPLLYLGSDFYTTTDKDSLRFIKRGD